MWLIGRGKVGVTLQRALRGAGVRVHACSAREVLADGPRAPRGRVDLIVLASRDGALSALASRLSALDGAAPVLHTAGSLGADVLAPLAARRPVGVAHPLLSFASTSSAPPWVGAALALCGDPLAVSAGRRLARVLGMRPLLASAHDPGLYHAAAALLANGTAALAATAVTLLVGQGYARRAAEYAVAALLRSVAHNISELGLPAALSGPVRRGDVETVRRHLAALPPGSAALYRALVAAQIPLAKALGEAPPARLEELLAGL